jgi:hypothetical protein
MLRTAWHSHRALSVAIGSICAATLVAGITFSLISGATTKHPSVAPPATGPSRPATGARSRGSNGAQKYQPSYVTSPGTPQQQQFDSELAADENRTVLAAMEALAVPAGAYSARYPAIPAADDSDAITFAEAFLAKLLNTAYRMDSRSALLAWAQMEVAANTLPGVPASVADKALYASLADPDVGGAGGASPVPSAAEWAADAAAGITQTVTGLEGNVDPTWSDVIAAGYVPTDPLLSLLNLSGTLTVSQPRQVSLTLTPAIVKDKKAKRVTVTHMVEQRTPEHFTIEMGVGSALHHPGYGAVNVESWTVSD